MNNISDILPIKKLTFQDIKEAHQAEFDGQSGLISSDTLYFKVTDVENLLLKLSKPENLTKVAQSLMFGKELKMDELLK